MSSPEPRFCPRCATPLATRTSEGKSRLACPESACGFVHYNNPTPVVAALLEHEGKVLLVRNKGWPEKWYGLVSGFLEADETPEEGVLREVREELGLSAQLVSLIGVYAFPARNELIVAYHLRAQGTVRPGEELADYKSVDPDKLKPWPFGTGLAVSAWLEARAAAGVAQ